MSGFKWVEYRCGGEFPKHAVEGGRDIDGTTIFVGRVRHHGDLLPAKVMPDKDVAYACHGGNEIAKNHCEVLVRPHFQWVFSEGGDIPKGAVVGGETSDGEVLYIGRVHSDGGVTVGKVHPSHGCCYVPFDCKENRHNEYEVLVCHY